MSLINDIAALFEKMARTFPAIGHNPDDGVYRFYGYNMDESNTGDKDTMTFPRMGLAMKTHAGLSGRFDNLGGALRDNRFAEVVILKNAATNDYAGEQAALALTEGIMIDMVVWLMWQATTKGEAGPWPVIGLMDIGNITYNRVGPITQDRAFGWKINLLFKQELTYNSSNALNSMVP